MCCLGRTEQSYTWTSLTPGQQYVLGIEVSFDDKPTESAQRTHTTSEILQGIVPLNNYVFVNYPNKYRFFFDEQRNF